MTLYNLKKGSASLGDLIDGYGSLFAPALIGNTYFVDPGAAVNGDGTAHSPFTSLLTAYNQCTAGQHDTVFMIGSDTAWDPAASLTWAKSHTHLIGISSPLPGQGQRCRIEGSTTNDLVTLLTVSASGCIFSNLKWVNLGDKDQDSGAVVVTGGRNAFINCQIAGMGHATPAARAGSYSLTLSGSENHFERCSIGLDTIVRAEANAELLVTGGARNSFWDCWFESYSETAGHFAVSITGMDRYIEFKDCMFYNFSVNWGNAITNAFSITVAPTHYVILRGACQFVGYTGTADTVGHVYQAAPTPSVTAGLSTQPTT